MLPDDAWGTRRTPALEAGSAFIHLNHASTSHPGESAFAAQEEYLRLERELGTRRAVERMEASLASVPAAIADLVAARPHQVALQPSSSRGFAAALAAVAPGKALEVFVTPYEWAANLMCVASTARARMTIVRSEGRSWEEAFARSLAARERNRVPVASLPLTSTTGAFLPDVQRVCDVARAAGAWLFVDAAQAVGREVVDFAALGADVLCFPARKWLRGPKGIAVAVFSDRALAQFGSPAAPDMLGSTLHFIPEGPRLAHGAGASRFQAYDQSPLLLLGLLSAVRASQGAGVAATAARIALNARRLRSLVHALADVEVVPGTATGFVCLRPAASTGCTVEALAAALWQAGVNVGVVGARYAPLQLQEGQSLLRLTPHASTAADEIARATSLLQASLAQGAPGPA